MMMSKKVKRKTIGRLFYIRTGKIKD